MLAFLDALCAALSQRDADALLRLLAHPLASALPDAVMAEVMQVVEGRAAAHFAPINALRLYHQTAHFLGMSRERQPAVPSVARATPRTAQMELPLQVA